MRRRAPGRFEVIISAATRVFGARGFTQAQMSDVAAEAGVSVGTLYNYVSGKEALLVACALHAFGELDGDGQDLPFVVADRGAMLVLLGDAVRRRVTLSTLSTSAQRRSVQLGDEVEAVVGELFDLLSSTRLVADAFERSAADAPDLAEVFYAQARGRLLSQLNRWLRRRFPTGPVAEVGSEVVARYVIETVTWLARHRHHDPTWTIGDDLARRSAIALVAGSLGAAR